MDKMPDSLRRFSDRVENYFRYRPRYPAEVVEFLSRRCGLLRSSVIADIGSGTGFLAELFLKNGNRVFAVEPNSEMRQAGEQYLNHYPAFRSISGMAEATGLAEACCDFVTAGQSFHWFDRPRARSEFIRILKPQGSVVLIWNDRRLDTDFLHDYENLLVEFGIDYQEVDHRKIGGEDLAQFFGTHEFVNQSFEYQQALDYASLQGRLLSSSYIPMPEHSRYQPMIQALRAVFEKHAEQGKVVFHYLTLLYASPLF